MFELTLGVEMGMVDKTRYSVTVRFAYTDCLNELVERGLYMDHQDAIRRALQDLFEKHGMDPFRDMSQKTDLPSPGGS